jgi:hypothetical protein
MQRQAMGVALHIVLLPFFELLHSTIDSYDAGLKAGFFLPLRQHLQLLLCLIIQQKRRNDMRTMWTPDQISASDPVPTDPVPIPEPIPQPQPQPDPAPNPDPIIDPPPHMKH